jgi:hypothetical protein
VGENECTYRIEYVGPNDAKPVNGSCRYVLDQDHTARHLRSFYIPDVIFMIANDAVELLRRLDLLSYLVEDEKVDALTLHFRNDKQWGLFCWSFSS